jgi:hypothetical protein
MMSGILAWFNLARAVALLLCVAVLITTLFNLCKTYLGNSPRMTEPAGELTLTRFKDSGKNRAVKGIG